jgi:hypothetical protein
MKKAIQGVAPPPLLELAMMGLRHTVLFANEEDCALFLTILGRGARF